MHRNGELLQPLLLTTLLRANAHQAQTILDQDIPELPAGLTQPLRDFLSQCLHRDPVEIYISFRFKHTLATSLLTLPHCYRAAQAKRLPAEALLGAPWLQRGGAVSTEASVAIVRAWIDSLTGGGK